MAAAVVSTPIVNVDVNVVDGDKPAAAPAMKVVVAASGSMADTFDRVDSVMRDDNDATKTDTTTIHPTNNNKGVGDDKAAATHPGPNLPNALPTTKGAKEGSGGVRILGLHEWKAAALCLAEAFAEDHMAMYFLDTPDRTHWSAEQKWALHVKIMEYVTYAHLLKGLVVCAGEEGRYECVALWMPPGQNMDDLLTIIRSGMWRLNYELSREGKKRFFTEFLPLLHDTKAQVLGPQIDNDSWYLVYIGTRPSARGKGYARKVIDHVTSLADREGRVCYLESSNEVNRKIYGRMGFELKKEIFLQRAEEVVALDIMVREAQKSSKPVGGGK